MTGKRSRRNRKRDEAFERVAPEFPDADHDELQMLFERGLDALFATADKNIEEAVDHVTWIAVEAGPRGLFSVVCMWFETIRQLDPSRAMITPGDWVFEIETKGQGLTDARDVPADQQHIALGMQIGVQLLNKDTETAAMLFFSGDADRMMATAMFVLNLAALEVRAAQDRRDQ